MTFSIQTPLPAHMLPPYSPMPQERQDNYLPPFLSMFKWHEGRVGDPHLHGRDRGST